MAMLMAREAGRDMGRGMFPGPSKTAKPPLNYTNRAHSHSLVIKDCSISLLEITQRPSPTGMTQFNGMLLLSLSFSPGLIRRRQNCGRNLSSGSPPSRFRQKWLDELPDFHGNAFERAGGVHHLDTRRLGGGDGFE